MWPHCDVNHIIVYQRFSTRLLAAFPLLKFWRCRNLALNHWYVADVHLLRIFLNKRGRSVKITIKSSVIWDAMTVMWPHCDVYHIIVYQRFSTRLLAALPLSKFWRCRNLALNHWYVADVHLLRIFISCTEEKKLDNFFWQVWLGNRYLSSSGFIYSQSLKIDRSKEGLEVVPRNLDKSVTESILSNNELITLNSNSFDLYVQLSEINLRSCKTTYIEDGTFDNQDKLITLLLDRCAIMQLPQSFGPSTTTLQHFQIYRGYKSSSIFRYPYFAAFISLYRLDLGAGKDLEPFNSNILPSNIIRFRMDYSRLLTFQDFKHQTRLIGLTVIGNSISIIPQEHISTLSVLLEFRAQQNDIEGIPDFSHINDNAITSFSHEHISGLVSLETLKAGNNLIHTMPNISYLPKLESADFSNNLIRYVPAKFLYGLPMLESLYLNGNRITLMDDNSMATGDLYLHDNKLESPPDLYDMKFASLTLRENPLACNQLLCWLRMWSFNKTLPQLDMIYCASPLPLNSSLVMDAYPTVLGCYKGECQE